MAQMMSEVIGCEVHGPGGPVGRVVDVVFDYQDWDVPFLVVEIAGEPGGALHLVSTYDVGDVSLENCMVTLRLDLRQVNHSPAVEPGKPVVDQILDNLDDYEHWPEKYRTPHSPESGEPDPEASSLTPLPNRRPFYFRSVQDVQGYRVEVSDGAAGRVHDFLIDARRWTVLYLVINLGSLNTERLVLMAPAWIKEIRKEEQVIRMDLAREVIAHSQEYDPNQPIEGQAEEHLRQRDRRPADRDSREQDEG